MNELVTWDEVKQVLAFTDDDMTVWVRDGEWWVDLPNLNLAPGVDDLVFHPEEVNQFVQDLRELVALREQSRAGRRLSKDEDSDAECMEMHAWVERYREMSLAF